MCSALARNAVIKAGGWRIATRAPLTSVTKPSAIVMAIVSEIISERRVASLIIANAT